MPGYHASSPQVLRAQERRLASLRRLAIRARTLLDNLTPEPVAVRATPPVEDDEPTALQRRIWALHFDLEQALMHAMPEGNPWYKGPECTEIESIMEKLERLVDDRLALIGHRAPPRR